MSLPALPPDEPREACQHAADGWWRSPPGVPSLTEAGDHRTGQSRDGLVVQFDQTPRVADEYRPLGRQRHSARRAVEQPPPSAVSSRSEPARRPTGLQQPFGGPRK